MAILKIVHHMVIFSSSRAASDEERLVKLNVYEMVIHNLTYREVQVKPSLPLPDTPVLKIRLEIDV